MRGRRAAVNDAGGPHLDLIRRSASRRAPCRARFRPRRSGGRDAGSGVTPCGCRGGRAGRRPLRSARRRRPSARRRCVEGRSATAVANPGPLHDSSELAAHGGRIRRAAGRRGEHQIVGVGPPIGLLRVVRAACRVRCVRRALRTAGGASSDRTEYVVFVVPMTAAPFASSLRPRRDVERPRPLSSMSSHDRPAASPGRSPRCVIVTHIASSGVPAAAVRNARACSAVIVRPVFARRAVAGSSTTSATLRSTAPRR